MNDRSFIGASLLGVLALVALSTPYPERMFWSLFADLDFNRECERLGRCLTDADPAYAATRIDDTNRCVISKGEYMRSFQIPELRGSLRTCEMLRGLENQGKY